ncbi:MAG: D-amino-acid transaminase [Alphaproteobacteria bacterium]|nr:D-amino-acid transaminase [Alphaproteobacteria bacterium]
MSRIAYVNGRYVPQAAAALNVEDRGTQFADGVYEVMAVVGGRLIDEVPHLDRLRRSLAEIEMRPSMAAGALRAILRETIARNRLVDGIVYLQINRGVAPRAHAFPAQDLAPSTVITVKHMGLPRDPDTVAGVAVITQPDIRWKRVDVKTVGLLANCMAKSRATEAGAYEAWLVDGDGDVTEGSSTNAWIVDRDGSVVTRPLGNDILPGITRASVLALARGHGFTVVERPFTVAEAKSAREAFLTGTTAFVKPIVRIDDAVIGNGHPGLATRALLGHYLDYVAGQGAAA